MTTTNVAPSTLVYLFGDMFAEAPKGVMKATVSTRRVIASTAGFSETWPRRVILRLLIEEAAEAGYRTIKAVEGGGFKKMMAALDPRKEPPMEVDVERVKRLRPEAEALRERLHACEQRLGELGPRLRKEIADGLDSTKTEESGFAG